jgi:SMC interacting uncharacterized protein involved in chromosome segregation
MDNNTQKAIDTRLRPMLVDLIKNINEKINLAKEAMALNLNIAEETQHKLWEKVEEISDKIEGIKIEIHHANNRIDSKEEIQEHLHTNMWKEMEKVHKRLRDIERVMPESKPPSQDK